MLARLRGWVVLAYTAVSMVFFFLVSLPDTILGRGDLAMWFAKFTWSRSILKLAGARVRVLGVPPLPDGPLIFACNHESALDILALVASLPRIIRFVAKIELFRIPVFGWYLRMGGHIAVDRGNHSRAVESLRRAGAAVRGGTSLIVFPEGTRSVDLRVHPFKKGPFVVAVEAGVPVDPRAFPDKSALLREVRRRVIEQHRAIGGAGGDPDDAAAAPGREGTSAPAGAPV